MPELDYEKLAIEMIDDIDRPGMMHQKIADLIQFCVNAETNQLKRRLETMSGYDSYLAGLEIAGERVTDMIAAYEQGLAWPAAHPGREILVAPSWDAPKGKIAAFLFRIGCTQGKENEQNHKS